MACAQGNLAWMVCLTPVLTLPLPGLLLALSPWSVVQVTCEARRVTDSISINGICSLIPVATCCEPDNPDEGIVFAISQAARSRREKKGLKDKRTSYQQ